mgnify:CR=1 FL=1
MGEIQKGILVQKENASENKEPEELLTTLLMIFAPCSRLTQFIVSFLLLLFSYFLKVNQTNFL